MVLLQANPELKHIVNGAVVAEINMKEGEFSMAMQFVSVAMNTGCLMTSQMLARRPSIPCLTSNHGVFRLHNKKSRTSTVRLFCVQDH